MSENSQALSTNSSDTPQHTDFDVIVIGADMGGCAAGAITARHGLKILTLENSPRRRGNCSYYI